jgi:hypothetical protein
MTQTTVKFPATIAFVNALLAECAAKGYTVVSRDPSTETGLKENGGWCFLRLEGTHEAGASLIIPLAKHRLGNLHSHVDLQGHDGYVPLPKKNGKVICHFQPDVAKVTQILPKFLSAAKRATAAPTVKATPSPTVVTPVAAPATDLVAAAKAASMGDFPPASPEMTDAEIDALMADELATLDAAS